MQFIDFHIVLTLCKKSTFCTAWQKIFCPDLGIFWCGFLGSYAQKHQGSISEQEHARIVKVSGIELFEHPKI